MPCAQKHEDLARYWWNVWEREERELTRERGLWGPLTSSHLDKWILDASEGPCRMRKKMIANPLFYLHYPPHRPMSELEQGVSGAKQALILQTIIKCKLS